MLNNMQRQAILNRTTLMTQFNMRYFGVLPKLPKMELTVRTPYRTIFKDFAGFQRLYVRTDKGLMAIGNKSIPRVYLLPPGEMKVHGLQPGKTFLLSIVSFVLSYYYETEIWLILYFYTFIGEGNHANQDSGVFMHTGGWLFMHE